MKNLVIARYNEDIEWVKNINFSYIIFNKGEDINIPHSKLPNIGREADTYLNYIVNNYNNLSEYTILSQGNPFEHCKDFINKINSFNGGEDLIFLSDWIVEEDINGFPYATEYDLFNNFLKLRINEKIEGFKFPAGAQYIVHKNLITSKTLEWWEFCYQIFKQNDKSAWTFERFWPIIFKYSDKNTYINV